MINNYELLILNYIFNALHDFNSHHCINIGAVGLINLKRNRKVSIPSAAGALWGLHGDLARDEGRDGCPCAVGWRGITQIGCDLWGGQQEGV